MKALAILLSLLALTLSGAAQDASTLTVVGEGEILVPADVVYVSISATAQDENLAQASSNITEVLNRTIEALIDTGVNRDDLQADRGRSVSSIQTISRVYNNSTYVMVANETVTLVKEQVTIRFDAKEEDLINRTFEVAEAEGAEAAISGYALEDRSIAFARKRRPRRGERRRSSRLGSRTETRKEAGDHRAVKSSSSPDTFRSRYDGVQHVGLL